MTFPEPAASLLDQLVPRVRDLLGANLRGIYVYGSLAFGCYNPARSDVDILVVTRRRMAPETRRALASFLHRLAETAHVEISFLSRADLEGGLVRLPGGIGAAFERLGPQLKESIKAFWAPGLWW